MPVIEAAALRKHYAGFRGGTTALDHLDLEVPDGGVFGFLGPNGAGKTTLIRCLLGLVRPTSGAVNVLGSSSPGGIRQVIGKIGSIVETPAFFPRFSALRNLKHLGLLERVGTNAILQALDRVGLAGRERDLVRDYSLGMRQRLGLAAALLKDPELLVLDEPAHGLDPQGISDVRRLVRELGDEGRTVFLSSHLLGEVQAICDRVAIVNRGRCIATGTVAEVLARGRHARLFVRADRTPGDLVKALEAAGYEARAVEGGAEVDADPSEGTEINRALVRRRVYISELRPVATSLEEVFLQMTAAAGEVAE